MTHVIENMFVRFSGQDLNYTGVIRYVAGVSISAQDHGSYTIRWIPEAVANLLHGHNIETRTELAKELSIARSTVYMAFDENWSGEATLKVLAAMAYRFRVPLGRLVTEPGATRANGSGKVRKIGTVRP